MIKKNILFYLLILFSTVSLLISGCYPKTPDSSQIVKQWEEEWEQERILREAEQKKAREQSLKEYVARQEEFNKRMEELHYSGFKAYNLPSCAEDIAIGRTDSMTEDCKKYQNKPEVIEHVKILKQSYKYLGVPSKENFITGEIEPGMTQEEVLKAWGRPSDINTTESSDYYLSQWVYEDRDAYLYFEKGILTTIQE
jgi:hypothetical protein